MFKNLVENGLKFEETTEYCFYPQVHNKVKILDLLTKNALI